MEHAQWTVANSGVTEGLKSVIWSGRQYVVVGYNGVILTSGIPVQGLRPIAVLMGASKYLIGENGGVIFDGENLEILIGKLTEGILTSEKWHKENYQREYEKGQTVEYPPLMN